MAGGSHADVTYVYIGNSRRRRMEFSEKQRLLGDNATPVQVYYQRLYQRQLQISGGKGVPVQDLMSWSASLPRQLAVFRESP